jgi:choline dehydrogenase-like flavoprotein
MPRKLPPKDVAIIGLGWTGSILGYELCKAGLDVVAIERGPWRDTATDFPPAYAQDELRYAIRLDLFLRPDQETLTFRNNASQTALPIRNFVSFLPQRRRRRRHSLERSDLALPAHGLSRAQPSRAALRQDRAAGRHDDPGLAGEL